MQNSDGEARVGRLPDVNEDRRTVREGERRRRNDQTRKARQDATKEGRKGQFVQVHCGLLP